MKMVRRFVMTAVAATCASCSASAPDTDGSSVSASSEPGSPIVRARSALTPTVPRTCYVKSDAWGGGQGNGTHDNPYATVNEAIGQLCTTIYLRGGVHTEVVKILDWRGSEALRLVITPTPGEQVTLRGRQNTTDWDVPSQFVVAVLDSSYVTISGFTIEHDATGYCPWTGPTAHQYLVEETGEVLSTAFCHSGGITIASHSTPGDEGSGEASHHVIVSRNTFQNIRNSTAQMAHGKGNNNTTKLCACEGGLRLPACSADPGWTFEPCHEHAFALPVSIRSGRDTTMGDLDEATHHVSIVENTFRDSNISSFDENVATITMGLNVADVLVERNNISNIRPRPGATAQAMTGVQISGSTSSASPRFRPRRITVRRNRFADLSGSAVYAVQPTDVLIERNKMEAVPRGVQVASEPSGSLPEGSAEARNIWIRDNLIYNPINFGIDLGMQSVAYRHIHNVYVTNNTIVLRWTLSNRTSIVGIATREGLRGDSRIDNNIVSAGATSLDAIRPTENTPTRSDTGDTVWWWHWWEAWPSVPTAHNDLWYVASADLPFIDLVPTFVQQVTALPLGAPGAGGMPAGGFGGLRGNPRFVAGSSPVRLQATSPAIDAGTTIATPAWAGTMFTSPPETDYFGRARTYGLRRDIGMEEVQPGIITCGNTPDEAPYCRYAP